MTTPLLEILYLGPELHISGDESWCGTEAAMAGQPEVRMGQAWREEPSPGFQAASVRVGRSGGHLLVHAELKDLDIFNPVQEFNAPAYRQGDVFEIFLRPVQQERYFEFHVTPNNTQFQLSIPGQSAFREPRTKPGITDAWFIWERAFESRVSVEPEQNRWRVFARIPIDLVEEAPPLPGGREWLFSFSRYDYTQGAAEPVLSSTSPHVEVNFHRQAEWGRMRFE
jgi:hypothetical protein